MAHGRAIAAKTTHVLWVRACVVFFSFAARVNCYTHFCFRVAGYAIKAAAVLDIRRKIVYNIACNKTEHKKERGRELNEAYV